jgi:hypothetical protein
MSPIIAWVSVESDRQYNINHVHALRRIWLPLNPLPYLPCLSACMSVCLCLTVEPSNAPTLPPSTWDRRELHTCLLNEALQSDHSPSR